MIDDEIEWVGGITFNCDREQTKHDFRVERPFSDSDISFFMTNDLYAVQKNGPVKRLEWIDNNPDWTSVKIDNSQSIEKRFISCNQVEPFYAAPLGVVEHAPFNLVGCLEKSLESYQLVVYKTEIANETVQWKIVISKDLKVKKLGTDNILKLTVRSDPSENCFKFYMFTDSSHDYKPLLGTLNYKGNLAEFLLEEFNNLCVSTVGNLTERSLLAKNTLLCSKTIALQNENIPTNHGFITYDYTNTVPSTIFTKFDRQIRNLLEGWTLTASYRYHPDELNNQKMRHETVIYSLVPPSDHIVVGTCSETNRNKYGKAIDHVNRDCGGPDLSAKSQYCPFDDYTGLRRTASKTGYKSEGGNMQFTCKRGYVCTNEEYWCYSQKLKYKIYRWFDDLYPKNCRTELACNTTIIMGEGTEKIHIEDCVKKFNERKNNFFASKKYDTTFVNTDSKCMIDSLKNSSWVEVVINEYEKSVAPSYTGLSPHWIMIFILLSMALFMASLVFYMKLFNFCISRKTAKKQNDLKLTDYSKVDKSDNVYVHKESQLSDSDGIQIRKKSFFYEKCLQGCRHTDDCVKTEIKIILVKRMMDYFKLKHVGWIPGVREYISLRNTYFYLKELDDFVESNVDDLAKFNYQKVQGYYVHLATNLKKNEGKHSISKIGNNEDFELDNLMNVESNDHVSLNSSLDKSDDCALVIILKGEPSGELFINIFDLQCVQNDISFGR